MGIIGRKMGFSSQQVICWGEDCFLGAVGYGPSPPHLLFMDRNEQGELHGVAQAHSRRKAKKALIESPRNAHRHKRGKVI